MNDDHLIRPLWLKWKAGLLHPRISATLSPDGRYVQFCYRAASGYVQEWDDDERIARGLIMDVERGNVCARPFSKFFGYGEIHKPKGQNSSILYPTADDGYLVYALEKMDGTLGIIWPDFNGLRINTKNGFDNEYTQAAHAMMTDAQRKALQELFYTYPLTLMVEIVAPVSRQFLDYAPEQYGLYLLAARIIYDGEYMPMFGDEPYTLHSIATECGFKLPAYRNATQAQLVAACETERGIEGWVGVYQHGLWKFKTDWYHGLSRASRSLTPRKFIAAYRDGKNPLQDVPIELSARALEIDEQVQAAYTYVTDTIESAIERSVDFHGDKPPALLEDELIRRRGFPRWALNAVYSHRKDELFDVWSVVLTMMKEDKS